MKKIFLLVMAAAGLYSCQNDDVATTDSSFAMKASGADYNVCSPALLDTIVSGDLTAANGPHVWTKDRVWTIRGVLRVKGTTLTINPGTFIKADPTLTTGANGVLVITKDAQINAVGTPTEPIVFTSWKLLDCNAANAPAPGDFGGLVLLGNAPVNTGSVTNIIEGLGDQPNPEDFYFGGSTSGHDAGSLQYVRIEYGGRKLTPDVEINGLTFGGVGNAGLNVNTTKIHHIQVTYGTDDSYEWFGGTVNARNLVSFAPEDDNFDFDWGFAGSINYALALADRNSTHSLSGGNPDSNGIELDNDAAGSGNTPFTRPIINHLSVIGVSSADAGSYENGIHVRRNGRITLLNSTVAGYGVVATPNRYAINIESPSLAANSSFNNVGVNSYRTSPFTFPSSITNVTEATSTNFGMGQPFFNAGTLNFAGATNGAFVDGTTWIDNWTKFNNF